MRACCARLLVITLSLAGPNWLASAAAAAQAADPLPSWSDGAAKGAILNFVRAVTDRGAPTFVPPEDRIATFDNDGTLWVEQPVYTQLQFAIARVHALAPEHPEWKQKQPFAAILAGDRGALAKLSEHDAGVIVAATHSGMTPEQFQRTARQWFATAKHPRFGRPYTQLTYQPMLELLAFLRAHGFKTFIASGGGVDFMRVVTDDLYGIPAWQVIGSSGKTEFELRSGRAELIKLPEVSSIDDGKGKPMNIQQTIGKRPILAAGNSDGDLQMLQYADSGSARPRLALLLHHDDAEREYAYDRNSSVGRLDQALTAATQQGWTVISMKRDFKQIFPRERAPKPDTARQNAAKQAAEPIP